MSRVSLAVVLLAGAARAVSAAPEQPTRPKPAPAAPAVPQPAPAAPALPQPAPAAPAPAPPLPAPAPAPATPDAGEPEPVVEDEPEADAEPKPSAATFGVTPPPADMVRKNSRLLDLARKAHELASAGRCRAAVKLSPKVRKLDSQFHSRVFARDPLIAACMDPNAAGGKGIRPDIRYVLREVHADPPASGPRIAGEILFGMIVGSSGALVGALIGNAACIDGSDGGDCEASLIGGAYIGAILTIPFGVRAAGTSTTQTGSLGVTFLGSLLGGVGGLLMLANGRDDITAIGFILAPTIGATIGFNMTRRYKPRRVPVTGALLQWSDGDGVSLGVPIPTRVRSEERTVTSIPLLGGTF
jgi:hypothetical protein